MEEPLSHEIATALAEGLEALRPLAGRDSFNPEVPVALITCGLHRTPVPIAAGNMAQVSH